MCLTALPDLKKRQKSVENAQIENFKWDIDSQRWLWNIFKQY